jgi:glycosyltransferase involved in cell wall biosynthesis
VKILLINNHHRALGGAERYYLGLAKLLKSKGHQVAHFSVVHQKNINSKWKKYFVSYINLRNNGPKNFLKKISRMFYSLEAKHKIGLLLNDFSPDIVHINNIYHFITPSILGEIKKRGIPIVQTVHDYQLISPNSNLYYDGKVCEITKPDSYYKAFFLKQNSSYTATFMSILVSYVQHLFKFFEKNVDVFITPSIFMKNKLLQYEFRVKKIVHLSNFTDFSFLKYRLSRKQTHNKYILYFGRLDTAKGVLFLLDVAKTIPGIKFKLIGYYANKAIEKEIKDVLIKCRLTNVMISGYKEGKRLHKIIRNSFFVIVPSLWYENQPYSITESLTLGKVVVASKIGGIPELVEDGINGLLFRPGDVDECRKKILTLWNNPKLISSMEHNTQTSKAIYNPENYYRRLMLIYKKALLGKRA